jgi:hypothetical protein
VFVENKAEMWFNNPRMRKVGDGGEDTEPRGGRPLLWKDDQDSLMHSWFKIYELLSEIALF